MNTLLKFLIAGGIMGVLDALWLGVIAKKLYSSEIGTLLLEKPNMLAAGVFYVLYTVGVLVMVINPALEKGSWQYALGYGAFFGLIAYATYDLTNLATLKDWSLKVVVIDMLWGALLTGVVSVLSYWAIRAWLS